MVRFKGKGGEKSKSYFLWLRDKMGILPPSATYEEWLDHLFLREKYRED